MQLQLEADLQEETSGTVIPCGSSSHSVNPFKHQLLKWIGNKQRFAHEIISHFPKEFSTYHEPFIGSGGVLAVLAPMRAEGADSFGPLVGIWKMLKSDPERLKQWYRERWEEGKSGDKVVQYEKIKARYNASPNPADLLYLSRSAYGGIMRFRMKDGYMSTPCGVHNPIHFGTFSRRVDEWSKRVEGTEFFHREYQDSIDRAIEGDVVYCDPPYSYSQAILYGAQSFNQDHLFSVIQRAKRRGVFVALSLDGSKKSGTVECKYSLPKNLFEKEVQVNCGRSMLKRFQMEGKSLEGEVVADRLLLTHAHA
ncbi:MAG: Dam family site-specific DNA-(adenine-N6)-methyltransferase [Gammaproteobacteria bacterium]|nr:Dam family site-specific DNA-(adenine-N6)-methyltransferase [Gammaproteobacteria bacterium]